MPERHRIFTTSFGKVYPYYLAKAQKKGRTVCGIRVEEIQDPTMREIRYLDKLVDELVKGRPMEKILSP